MKTIKSIIAVIILVFAVNAVSAQGITVTKKGTNVVVTDNATKKVLCQVPATATATVPAITYTTDWVLVDGTSLKTFTSACANKGSMVIAAGAKVAAPTTNVAGALFSVSNGGTVHNYDNTCHQLD